MRRQSPQLAVLTGFATVGTVVAGFGENLLTNDVPAALRPAAVPVLTTALALQLGIVSLDEPAWLLSSLYVLLGFPIGVAVNVVAADLPADIRQTGTVVFVAAFLLVVLIDAAIGSLPWPTGRLRLPSAWRVLAALMWVFWGIVSGTVGGVLLVDFVNALGGPVPSWSTDNGLPLLHQCIISMAVVPLVGGIFAAWVTGRIRSGVGAGFVGATLALLIIVAYLASYEQAHSLLVGNIISTPLAGALVGIPAGFLGGLLGVGLHNVRWWARSDAW